MSDFPLIVCEGLCKQYMPGPWVVAPLDWKLLQGTACVISGPSGVGKSTFLALLGLLDSPSGGQYFFKGKNTREASATDRTVWRGSDMGFIFQNSLMLPQYTVLENLALPLYYQGARRVQAELQAKQALYSLDLAALGAHYPLHISGGQRQRIALLRALITRPAVLLADEPTGALDAVTAAIVLDHLQAVQRDTGMSVVIVTHDAAVKARFSLQYDFQSGGVLCTGAAS